MVQGGIVAIPLADSGIFIGSLDQRHDKSKMGHHGDDEVGGAEAGAAGPPGHNRGAGGCSSSTEIGVKSGTMSAGLAPALTTSGFEKPGAETKTTTSDIEISPEAARGRAPWAVGSPGNDFAYPDQLVQIIHLGTAYALARYVQISQRCLKRSVRPDRGSSFLIVLSGGTQDPGFPQKGVSIGRAGRCSTARVGLHLM